ncbi:DUF4232 domain-containing protein [Rhizomonospora bruguierae]|uniref:DUF4232 domain-containing protein n=1 Tax=Rhizomonospora bruguierae TaxID=1581705 RepID=UPI001BCFAB2E|nr:DUF4232 domain-containing protein [Micromonospora sp. NBRC 107566]
MRPPLRAALAAIAAAAGLVLAGCAEPGTVPTGTGLVPPTVTPPAVTAPTPATAPPDPVAPQTCTTDRPMVTHGPVEAGLGHRGMLLRLLNCGTKPYRVRGYPSVAILDGRQTLMPVEVRHGSSYFGRDLGPADLTLKPGGSAVAVLAWSATVTAGDPAEGAYLRVAPTDRDETTTYPVRFDLGTTGAVDVTAWSYRLPT